MRSTNTLKLLSLAIIAGALLTACCGEKICPDERSVFSSQMVLHNFTPGQADSVQIKEYVASSNFTTVLDSMGYLISSYDSVHSVCYVVFDSALYSVPDSAINFLLYFPSANLTYKVTNIRHQTVYCSKCLGRTTYGQFLSTYQVNDSVFTTPYGGAPIQIIR